MKDEPVAKGGAGIYADPRTRMAPGIEIRTEQDVEAMIAASHARPVVVFKHSVACGASARMVDQVAALDEPTDPPVYTVVVQYARAASNVIAERLGVRHETPQAIVVRGGRAVLHLNHYAITTEDLRTAARGPSHPA